MQGLSCKASERRPQIKISYYRKRGWFSVLHGLYIPFILSWYSSTRHHPFTEDLNPHLHRQLETEFPSQDQRRPGAHNSFALEQQLTCACCNNLRSRVTTLSTSRRTAIPAHLTQHQLSCSSQTVRKQQKQGNHLCYFPHISASLQLFSDQGIS